MSTTIQIKRSSTASAVPLTGDLEVGELAINLADKRLFTKKSDGTIVELSTNPTDIDIATLRIDGVEVTASAAELNSLDGSTASTADLNKLAAITATATELNKLGGFTGSTAELNILDGLTATTAELNFVDGVTSNVQTQLNAKQPLDAQLTDIAGLTPTDGSFIVGNGVNFVAESGNTAIASLGVTATAAELNTLDGVTATTAELNYTDGVTSSIQTQLNGKATSAQGALADTAVQPNDNVTFGTGDFTGSVDVTGTITADGLTVLSSDAVLSASIGTAGQRVYITPNGKEIVYNASGNSSGSHMFQTGNANRLNIATNGDVSFYEDTGTTAKMVWDASAETLGVGNSVSGDINASSGVADVAVGSGSGTSGLTVYSGSDSYGALCFSDGTSGTAAYQGYIKFDHTNNTLSYTQDNTERMRIDSAGNVGIGTNITTKALHVYKNGGTTLSISAGSNNAGEKTKLGIGTFVGTGDGGSSIQAETYHSGTTASTLEFYTSGTERARIDSSGNLLVGTTDTNPAGSNVNGVAIRPTGYASSFTGEGGQAINLNRKANDGDIARFSKDGSTVGSIGVSSTNSSLYMGKTNTGLMFWDAQSAITPCNNAGVVNNGAVDLGTTNYKFRDLRLSGGVYLGGTGAANKLDDYETGTVNVTVAPSGSGTLGFYSTEDRLAYTKVGNLVTITGRLIFNSTSSPLGGSIAISTLPFVIADLGETSGFIGGSVSYRDQTDGSWSNIPFYGLEADNKIYMVINASLIGVDDRMHFSFSYFTNS